MAESGFKYKITLQKQQNTPTITNNTKKRKRKIIWFNPPFSLNVSTNIGKKFFSLLGKHFPKTHQLHQFFNRNNVKVNYCSLPNCKSLINGHNKNILDEQEKPSPCNCRDKTSCPLNGSCQHKNLVYFCKVSTPDIKQNHPHYIGLYRHNNFFKYESKRNSTEFSNFIWGKKKDKINVYLDWSILDKPKPYSPASKKCMLCLTEKYHIIFPTKNLLNKPNELVIKCRHTTIIACLTYFFPKQL